MKNFVKEGQKLPLYGVGPYIVYGIEKEKNAEKLLSVISEIRPDIRIERQTP
mgnify:CR=1 FL=1